MLVLDLPSSLENVLGRQMLKDELLEQLIAIEIGLQIEFVPSYACDMRSEQALRVDFHIFSKKSGWM